MNLEKYDLGYPDPKKYSTYEEEKIWIRKLIEKIYGLLTNNARKYGIEVYKSILDYSKNWPEKIKRRVDPILGSCPRTPQEPYGPTVY